MKNRIGRIIVAVIFLIGFGYYTYKQEQIHSHSVDVESWGEAVELHPEAIGEGVDMSKPVEYVEETPEESASAPEPTPEPTPEPLRFDLTSWELMLVNGDHSIDQYAPEELAYISNTLADATIHPTNDRNDLVPVDARIAQPLLDFLCGCRDAGLPVFLSSGYRSYSEQAENFRRVCENNGITDGKDSNGYYITMPAGCSEHQSGLCCDITDKYYPVKNPSDPAFQAETYVWLREHCADYGFILRFPEEKEAFTGVMYEPWHFRYVGKDAAAYIMENDLTLEELWQQFGT
jgi:D-alanyl-D-alanine carboxypeptidase